MAQTRTRSTNNTVGSTPASTIPDIGTPGGNRLFGGAAGAPRQIQARPEFGNTANSVFSTSGARAGGAQQSATGGLFGTSGLTGTGGLQSSTGAPTGGIFDSFGSATGGIHDAGFGSAATGGLHQGTTVGFGVAGRSGTGGRLDSFGNSATGGAGVGSGFLSQQSQ